MGVHSHHLKNAMEGAGHTWTLDHTVPFTIESVKQYDGIFLSGNVADNQVLIDYVNGGGNVYLCGGTGAGGGAAGEAKQWKSFLNAFGFEFEGKSYNGSSGARPIADTHPVLAGVTQLYFANGSAVNDIKPDDTANGILVSYDTGGAIGVYDGAPPPTIQDGPVSIESKKDGNGVTAGKNAPGGVVRCDEIAGTTEKFPKYGAITVDLEGGKAGGDVNDGRTCTCTAALVGVLLVLAMLFLVLSRGEQDLK